MRSSQVVLLAGAILLTLAVFVPTQARPFSSELFILLPSVSPDPFYCEHLHLQYFSSILVDKTMFYVAIPLLNNYSGLSHNEHASK
jgi:hypothetical protein